MTTRTNLVVLCSVWLLQCSSAVAEYYDVVVIGAGWAGLGAAKTMQESDEEVSVLILDAHDYVGGRCKSTEMFDGAVYEEGTAYLTGIESNPVYDYGVSVGTNSSPTPTRTTCTVAGNCSTVTSSGRITTASGRPGIRSTTTNCWT